MARRLSGLDTLGEIRRALRILRRTERWLIQQERDAKRAGARSRAKWDEQQRRLKAAKDAQEPPPGT